MQRKNHNNTSCDTEYINFLTLFVKAFSQNNPYFIRVLRTFRGTSSVFYKGHFCFAKMSL